jgi:hypothetical protein
MTQDDDVGEKRLGEERVTAGDVMRVGWREAFLHSRDQGPQ